MSAEAMGGEEWTRRYETLRREALTAQSPLQTVPLGLALLIRHGVAQWMRQWSLEPQDGAHPTPSKRSDGVRPFAEGQEQLPCLLAQIAMQHLQLGYSQ